MKSFGSRSQFANKVITQPYHIGRDWARSAIAPILHALRNERPEEDCFGDPLPKMQIIGGVAVVPIVGMLMMNVPQWAKELGLGITDANDIEEEVESAVADANVEIIVQNFDSGGGWSIAGDKLFDIMEWANRKKPVFSYVADGACCYSSAYESAAPSRAILTGKYAGVGSIGTYQVQMDDSEFWKAMGITIEVFRSGELKGIGEDALSEAQRSYLMAETEKYGTRFRKNVAKYRTMIDPVNMQGQWYLGLEAAQQGFTAGIAADLNEAIAKFRRML